MAGAETQRPRMAEQPVAARRTVTTLLLNAAAIVERADEGILPAVGWLGLSKAF